MLNIKLKSKLLTSSLLIALLFSACDNSSENLSNNSVNKANSMVVDNNIYLKDTNGNTYTVLRKESGFVIKEHPNKVIIFDIFATWCPPCQQEAIHLSNLQKKYKDNLLVLGITIEEEIQNAQLQNFSKQYNATYQLVNSKDNQKAIHAIASATNVGSQFPIPLMVMYKDGKYITHYVGATPQEMIDSDIRNTLKEKN